MPKSNWKGVVSFGLVSIPVSLYPTENPKADISFHQIDKRNNARIKYQRINTVTGKIVEWKDIIKGYEYDEETIIPVPEEVIKKLAQEKERIIEIHQFISKNELDSLAFDRSYYMAPEKNGEKGYVILREALAQGNKIGIAKVVISTKEYLAAIMPYQNKALILYLLKYSKEMRTLDEIEIPDKDLSAYRVTKKEIQIAKQLVNAMSDKWKPEKYVDKYQEVLHQWVEEETSKAPHKFPKKTKIKPATNVIDFVSLLKRSISKKSKQPILHFKAKVARHATKH